jgi:DNA-directed RNA polymerase alpha subunit
MLDLDNKTFPHTGSPRVDASDIGVSQLLIHARHVCGNSLLCDTIEVMAKQRYELREQLFDARRQLTALTRQLAEEPKYPTKPEKIGDHIADAHKLWATTPSVLLVSIDELEISVRPFNCLYNNGIRTLGDLVKMTPSELMRLDNFGRKSLKDVVSALAHYGLKLDGEMPGRRW